MGGRQRNRFAQRITELLAQEMRWELRLSVRSILLLCGMSIALLYMLWSAFWFSQVGLYAIKWHTRLAVTGTVFGSPALLFALIHRWLRGRWSSMLSFAGITLTLTAVLLEAVMGIACIGCTYMEWRAGHYQSPYEQNMGNFYNIRKPGSTTRLETPEFSFPRKVNSLGYSDREWAMGKDSGTVRIITIGDSFTEGDGAPADSAYPILLQHILTEKGIRAEVLNAGVSGSDPVFGLRNLEDRLLAFQPDIVIQTVSSDDMLYDIPLRGGMDRFGPDGDIRFARPPVWEPLVAASLVSRLLLRMFGMDINRPNGGVKNPAHVHQMENLLRSLMARQDSLGLVHGFHSIWAVHPLKHESQDRRHVFPFEAMVGRLPLMPASTATILLDCYCERWEHEGTAWQEAYWVKDGHHNARGYLLMAECTGEKVIDKAPQRTNGLGFTGKHNSHR